MHETRTTNPTVTRRIVSNTLITGQRCRVYIRTEAPHLAGGAKSHSLCLKEEESPVVLRTSDGIEDTESLELDLVLQREEEKHRGN